MNRNQLRNDPEESLRAALDGRQAITWTAIPGIVQSVDLGAMTCEVQPSIQAQVINSQGIISTVNLPLLVDVPIVFPASGGFGMTFPMAAGDEVLVVFSSRCIDAWWQYGGIAPAMEARMHDLSDGFAIPGPKSQPNVLPSINSTKVQLRNNAGTVYFGMGSKFAMVNETTDLKTLLSDFQSAVNGFMSAMAGLGVVGTATNASISIPALAAVSALGAVSAKINALLETA